MNIKKILFQCGVLLLTIFASINCRGEITDTIPPRYKVTLPEAHIGNLEIDTRLLDSYILLPDNKRDFYFKSRSVFSENLSADFTNKKIVKAAQKNNLLLMGGPLLGKLSDDGVTVWLRPSTKTPLLVEVTETGGDDKKTYKKKSIKPGVEQRIKLDGLKPGTKYNYTIYAKKQKLAGGSFTTAPPTDKNSILRVTFGSCFHKIGLHNTNLIKQIKKREPDAMMLLGDIAVDDRENQINMHRSDYLLRDLSKPWSELAANIPLYSSWDDHDYFNNDLNGIPKGFNNADREKVREVWFQNWNNPINNNKGIYFNTRIGPVEIIMLDTRSCRENKRRGEYGSFLGLEQIKWLKEILKNSKAQFKIISSGTMWSDYMSKAKDSWGTWDTEAREEIFSFIEKEKISGVLLISGDRHGARGFTIPRKSGFAFYEFEAASLGGVPGPDAMAKDSSNQLFGYHGTDAIAFGEFTFDTKAGTPSVTFRLINEYGRILEEYLLPYNKLNPGGN
jgi:alkaline phosphatase D